MTHSIFRYTDPVYEVGVDARTSSDGGETWLTLRIFEDSLNLLDARAVDLDRDAVRNLRDTLTAWLGEDN